jgi:hypothetical protein
MGASQLDLHLGTAEEASPYTPWCGCSVPPVAMAEITGAEVYATLTQPPDTNQGR